VLLAGALYGATSIGFLVWCTTAAFAALVACAWRMPAPPVHREAGVVGEVGKLLGNRAFLLLLVAIATGQAAGTCYDTTLALHLRHLGYSKDFLGLVVGIGTAAEVVVIAASGRVLARLGSERALVVAFGVAAVRWFSLSLITSTAGLVIQAPLHALSFGLYWVAATTLMREYTGTRAPAAGQGLLGAAVAIGTIAGNVSGGRMLERGGGSLVFAYAAGVSGVAAVLAALHALVLRRAAPGR
jgi:PPP family 3-phenylpropionic acid transporter